MKQMKEYSFANRAAETLTFEALTLLREAAVKNPLGVMRAIRRATGAPLRDVENVVNAIRGEQRVFKINRSGEDPIYVEVDDERSS